MSLLTRFPISFPRLAPCTPLFDFCQDEPDAYTAYSLTDPGLEMLVFLLPGTCWHVVMGNKLAKERGGRARDLGPAAS